MNSYTAGIYIRLSKEDLNKKDNYDSESVKNQKELLIKYAIERSINIFDIYIDDGFSGTNFERPNFKRMIQDIDNNKINMVIVKDLSRLGRDYVLTGYYLDFYFPRKNIRFVSLIDNIDTISDNSLNDIVPFKSIINDIYSRDNSRKIKAALRIKQELGKWVGGCPPFGYKVDEKNKNHLIINESESIIVKKIYSLFLRGYSISNISTYLYDNNILTPNIYRNINKKSSSFWSNTTIKNILTNQLYTGDLIQNRRSRISYKVRKLKKNNINDWIIVKNTHEPIVSKKDFDHVQDILKNHSNIKSNKKYDYLLCGLLFCSDCNKRIVLQKNSNHMYTVCNTYKKYSKLKLCKPHYTNYDELEKKVLNVIKKILSTIDISSLVDRFKKNINKNCNNRIIKIKDIINKLYIDKLEDKINDDIFNNILSRYKNELLSIENSIDYDCYVKSIICNYSKSFIFKLLNKIVIYNDKSIDIFFNFKYIAN